MKSLLSIIFLSILSSSLYGQKIPIHFFMQRDTTQFVDIELYKRELKDTVALKEIIKAGTTTYSLSHRTNMHDANAYLKVNNKKFIDSIDLAELKTNGKAKCKAFINGKLVAVFPDFDISYFFKENISHIYLEFYSCGIRCSQVRYQYVDIKGFENYPREITPRDKIDCGRDNSCGSMSQLILASPESYKWDFY